MSNHWLSKYLLMLSAVLILLISMRSLADIDFSYSGFVSQGVAVSEDNNYFGKSKSVSFDITELGINGVWEFDPKWRAAGQVIYRSIGQVDAPKVNLDYGFVDYRAANNPDSYMGIRFGRVKNPYGFYNETRDVAFTRPSALLSQTLYLDALRDFTLSTDGLNIYSELLTEYGSLRFDSIVGVSQFSDATRDFLFKARARGELKGEGTWVTRLQFESASGNWLASYTKAYIDSDYNRSAQDVLSVSGVPVGVPIGSGSFDIEVDNFSLRYQGKQWDLGGEGMLVEQVWDGFGPLFDDQDAKSIFGYIQGRYYLSSKWILVARWERIYRDTSDRSGVDFNAATKGTLPAHNAFHKNNVLGLRWEPNDRWVVAIEGHDIQGTYTLTDYAAITSGQAERNWQLFVAIASYRF